MSEAKRTRKRAVQLTADAMAMLEAALYERWKADRKPAKLTREARARYLGVSGTTADRILGGQGVDRASLMIAFTSLGMRWHDEFCLAEAESQIVRPDEHPARSYPTRVQRRWLQATVAVVAVCAVGALSQFVPAQRQSRAKPQPYWGDELRRLIDEGTVAFQRAEYSKAEQRLSAAIAMARRQNAGSELANSLRLSGDVAAAKGRFTAALELYRESLWLRKSFDVPESIPPILEAMGDVETRLGRFADAATHLTTSLRLFRELGDRGGVAMAMRDLGSLAFDRGDPHEAERWFVSALDVLDVDTTTDLEVDIRARLALVWRDRGRLADAREALLQCLSHWRARGHPRWCAVTNLQLGTVEFEIGHVDAAAACLRSSREGFAAVGDQAGGRNAQDWLARMPGTRNSDRADLLELGPREATVLNR